MLQKTVLVNRPIHARALQLLEREVPVLTTFDLPAGEVRGLLPQVRGIVLGIGLTLGATEFDLATHLEVVGRHGIGLDNVDVAAATERNIPVTYTPDGPTESTAEHALLLILATARRLSHLDRAVRTGEFSIRDRPEMMGRELEGKTIGMVGFGRVGRRLAAMCRDGLRMQVRVYDPYLDAESRAVCGADLVEDLVQLAGMVDILSIHTPLTAETRHLIGRKVLGAVKPGAIVINTSRGPVVDEVALIEALEKGRLGGAGLDVYDPQPPAADNPLLGFDQVVLTPHVGSFTQEGRERMGLTVVEDVLRALRGVCPHHLANPEVWPRRRGI